MKNLTFELDRRRRNPQEVIIVQFKGNRRKGQDRIFLLKISCHFLLRDEKDRLIPFHFWILVSDEKITPYHFCTLFFNFGDKR